LELRSALEHEEYSFLKFPSGQLKQDDTITSAWLKLFKYGGGGGPVRVDVASCDWSRSTMTYTKSLNLMLQRASRGVTAKLPEENQVWVTIELKGDAVQNARLTGGDHICFAVKGGPAAGGAAQLSSELTTQAPELKIDVKEADVGLKYATEGRAPSVGNITTEDQSEMCKDRLKREVILDLTQKQLEENEQQVTVQEAVLRGASQADSTANDVLNVLQAQTDTTQLAGDMVVQQTSAIENTVQTQLTQQLTAFANSGATLEELQAKEAELQQGALSQTAAASNQAAQQIQSQTNQGLNNAQQQLQQQDSAAAQVLQTKIAALKSKGVKLTAVQEAQINAKATIEVGKRASECLGAASTPVEQEAEVQLLDQHSTEVQLLD